MSEFRHTTQHGAIEGLLQTQEVKYYNLDVIISVGYRVKSRQGTMFRIWATQQLRNYIIRGYALNEALFKKGNSMNYFRELIEKKFDLYGWKISHELAKQKAESEYTKYKEVEKEQIHLESIKELDKDIKQLKGK